MSRLRPVAQLLEATRAASAVGRRSIHGIPLFLMVVLNQVANVGATTSFAISGRCDTFVRFLTWQAIGSAFGLGTQLTFAGMARVGSVQMANAIGIGLAFVSAQVVGAHFIFREAFSRLQWVGVGIVFVGLLLIAAGRS